MKKKLVAVVALVLSMLMFAMPVMASATTNSDSYKAQTVTTNKSSSTAQTVTPNVKYNWNVYNIGIQGHGTAQFLGPSGNNYDFSTAVGWPFTTWYTTFQFTWSGATSNADVEIKCIDTSDNSCQVAYLTGSSGTVYVDGLKDATYEVMLYNENTSNVVINQMNLTDENAN